MNNLKQLFDRYFEQRQNSSYASQVAEGLHLQYQMMIDKGDSKQYYEFHDAVGIRKAFDVYKTATEHWEKEQKAYLNTQSEIIEFMSCLNPKAIRFNFEVNKGVFKNFIAKEKDNQLIVEEDTK